MANLSKTVAIAGAAESDQIGMVPEKPALGAVETPEDARPR
jgi:hypothetical protein